MTVREEIEILCNNAAAAATQLALSDTESKNALLVAIADALAENTQAIIDANATDLSNAGNNGVPTTMLDRLKLTPARIESICASIRDIAKLDDPIGKGESWTRPSGIEIHRVRVPLGVVGIIYEARPNVTVDSAVLCLKTGNAVVLRGGKEAIRSNAALAASVRAGLAKAGFPADAVQFVEVLDHAAVAEMVRAVGLIDVAIPRGGERLIRAMCEAALIPVLKHYKGVCHLYVDDAADLSMALSILDNAKRQRPSACNAAECLLVHEKLAPLFLPMVRAWAADNGVTLHEGEAGTEYLSLDLNVATVAGYREAIDFVNANSSHHSDCIVTGDAARAAEFLRDVDSACVYHNVSTRFTDGAEFGMGAEIGISTDKLHARGPMGLEELTTYKYIVTGDGTVRA